MSSPTIKSVLSVLVLSVSVACSHQRLYLRTNDNRFLLYDHIGSMSGSDYDSIELNGKIVDLVLRQQLQPEFLKINPQHTLPTIIDDGFVLWESRPILIYLVERYGKKDDSLYPECPKKRAVINQRLNFDMGTLFHSYANYFNPQVFGKQPADAEKLKKFEESLEMLNVFLEHSTYVTGETLTVADISLVATVSIFFASSFDLTKYTNVKRWFEHCRETIPSFNENWEGCLLLKEMLAAIQGGKIQTAKK